MPLIRMKACGMNKQGQIGDGTETQRRVLTPVQLFDLPIQVDGGTCHCLAVLADGSVWAWGDNTHGQLGDGTTTVQTIPTQVVGPDGTGFLSNIVAVAVGGANSTRRYVGSPPESPSGFSLALRDDGTVWAWGYNGNGQLGIGTTINHITPVQVVGLTDVIAIAAGGASGGVDAFGGGHALALKSDGTVWGWGRNNAGQLGDGTTTDRLTPVQVAGLTDVIAIAAGACDQANTGGHSLALKADGTVWAWGQNGSGQLGDGTTTNRLTPVQVAGLTDVIAIAAGGSQAYALFTGQSRVGHSLALKADGTVWAWGYNGYGQLGDGTTINRFTPVQVSGLSAIKKIACGGQHSLALASDGTVFAWGNNAAGQLGDNTTQHRTLPIQVPGSTQTTDLATGNGATTLLLQGKQALIFADPDGNQMDTHVLGRTLAGATLGPVGVDLYNGTGIAVTQVRVAKHDLPGFPDPDTIEISSSEDPFVGEDPLPFNGTFAPEQKIGTVWARVQTQVEDLEGNPNQGVKKFKLSGTSQPA